MALWGCGLGSIQGHLAAGYKKRCQPLHTPTHIPHPWAAVFGREPSAAAVSHFPSKAPTEAAGTQGVLVRVMVKSEIKLSIQSLTQGSVR